MADWSNIKVESAHDRRKKRTDRLKQEKFDKEKQHKKSQITVVILAAVILVSIVVISIIAFNMFNSQKKEEVLSRIISGSFRDIKGKIEVNKKSIGFFDIYEEDMVLQEGDGVRTGPDSSLRIDFSNTAYVKLFSGSTAFLEKLAMRKPANPENSPLDIQWKLEEGCFVFSLPRVDGDVSVSCIYGTLTADSGARCVAKLETGKSPADLAAKKPVRVIVQSGTATFRNKLGTKSIRLKTYEEVFIWEEEGFLKNSKPEITNPGTEPF
ncbi:MAG: hypothetical protein PHQ23_02005 [Candidatus Wallbacteria bacterium]|nr:hypothetical protein [Candidatus Wallbacteria bacterium]